MKDLRSLAQGYLSAEGWDVKARGRDLLRGDRDGRRGDDEKDYVYVWVPDDMGSSFASRELPYLRQFGEAQEQHPSAEKVLLVETLRGLSSRFREDAKHWYGVKVYVPAQFFDTNFRWENDERAASASSELRKRGAEAATGRVKQPFSVLEPLASGTHESGSDLLEALCHALRGARNAKDRPTIHIVVGPAGMGKSVLFESLYASLYEEFLTDKRARHLSARPFALLPEYLEDASSSTVRSILDNYLRTEFAGSMDREIFNWRLAHGLGIWLLDGLDEILERDNRFFDDLADLMTTPGSDAPPSVVICVRDSLFATHRGLNNFCTDYRDNVTVYKLDRWQLQAKQDFANNQFESADQANAFVRFLADDLVIDELASTPYYCSLLSEEFRDGALQDGYDETEVLERGLERIIERERDKELLRDISNENIRDFIETCAIINLFDGGISAEDVQDYAEIVMPSEIDDDERERLITQMGQIATFAQGSDGKLRFAQEALEHYLAAVYLAKGMQRAPENMSNLGRQDLSENVVRLIPSCLMPDTERAIWDTLLAKMNEDSTVGRNVLRLAVRMSANTNRLMGLAFAGLDLSGLRFDNHGLQKAVFDAADLTNADFSTCDLTGASFNNCLFKNTILPEQEEMLRSITFGGMQRFHTAYVGPQFVDDVALLKQALGEAVEGGIEALSTCAAARQLRHLFGKYVEETGRGRRKDLPVRALMRGSHLVSNLEDIIQEAVRSGYLEEGQFRGRLQRPEDESYREIVAFRTELKLSPGLKALLDETCQDVGCLHVE